jgi:hypothetical protein
LDHVFKFYQLLHTQQWTQIATRVYVFNKGLNRHALLITTTKLEEVRFLLILHYRFANATQISMHKHKLENMSNQPNNIHIPYCSHIPVCWSSIHIGMCTTYMYWISIIYFGDDALNTWVIMAHTISRDPQSFFF